MRIVRQLEGSGQVWLDVVAAHKRCTLAVEMPAARAIVRQRPGASVSPANRSLTKR